MLRGQIVCTVQHASLVLPHSTSVGFTANRTLPLLAMALQLPIRTIQSTSKDHTTLAQTAAVDNKVKLGFFSRIAKKIKIIDKQKYLSMGVGYFLYEHIVDTLDYSKFYKDFEMEDTMYSWYLVTELHVWMLLVRVMAEGHYGNIVKDYMVRAMWEDIAIRMKKLGAISISVKNKQLKICSGQFNATALKYDEALLTDDMVLANALWSIFFCMECNNPVHLEQMVAYVRKTLNYLDQIPAKEMWKSNPSITWLDFQKCM